MAVTLGSIPFAGPAMLGTGGLLAIVGIVLIVIGIIVGRRAGAVDQLLATGIPATAQVMGRHRPACTSTSSRRSNCSLLVTIAGQTPYAAKHKSFVPLILLGRLTSGAPLSVRVDPTDLNRIAVDWQSSGAIGSPMGDAHDRRAAHGRRCAAAERNG